MDTKTNLQNNATELVYQYSRLLHYECGLRTYALLRSVLSDHECGAKTKNGYCRKLLCLKHGRTFPTWSQISRSLLYSCQQAVKEEYLDDCQTRMERCEFLSRISAVLNTVHRSLHSTKEGLLLPPARNLQCYNPITTSNTDIYGFELNKDLFAYHIDTCLKEEMDAFEIESFTE